MCAIARFERRWKTSKNRQSDSHFHREWTQKQCRHLINSTKKCREILWFFFNPNTQLCATFWPSIFFFTRFFLSFVSFHIYVPYHNRIVLYFGMFTCYDFGSSSFWLDFLTQWRWRYVRDVKNQFFVIFSNFRCNCCYRLSCCCCCRYLNMLAFSLFLIFFIVHFFPLVMLCDRFGYAFSASTHHTSSI